MSAGGVQRGNTATTTTTTTKGIYMNVTVVTTEQVDYGTGSGRRWVFPDAKFTTENEDLHVYRNGEGTIATFPKGSWVAVVRHEDLIALPEEAKGGDS